MSALRQRLRPLASFRGRARVVHLTTFAFFLSFVVWFDLAPFAGAIKADLHLTKGQLATLGLCNLALTIPARALVGIVLDRVGPRRLFSVLLVAGAVPNTVFALARSFPVLVASRLLVGIIGAGFVVGIRMVAEWTEAEDLGTTEGIYGGWGNFGSAGAALLLPGLATLVASGPGAWRWGVGLAGLAAAAYGAVYWKLVDDTPSGVAYQRPARKGAMQVRSRGAALALGALHLPMAGALGLVAWRVHRAGVIDTTGLALAFAAIAGLLAWQLSGVARANAGVLRGGPAPHDRPFAPVALLSMAYGVTFGAELAVVSLLPTFFAQTFALKITAAGAAGSAFAFTNLVTRPGGGIASDLARSRRKVLLTCLVGSGASFLLLATLDKSWPLGLGVAAVAVASVFVQGGNGAVFAMVPQLHKPTTGQVSGLAGAMGNTGGVLFTSVLFFAHDDAHLLFLVVAGCAVVVAAACALLPEAARRSAVAPVPAPAAA